MRYHRKELGTSMFVNQKTYNIVLLYAKEHDTTLVTALTRLVILGACKTLDLKEVAESHEANEKKNDK